MTLMWSRCIHYVSWNKEKKREETVSDWKETNVIEKKKERNEDDKIEIKKKANKGGKEGRNELNAQYTLPINAHHSPDLDPFSFAQNSLSVEIRCQHCCSHMKTVSLNLNYILSFFSFLYHLNTNDAYCRHFFLLLFICNE
jgi:hypothetical protein